MVGAGDWKTVQIRELYEGLFDGPHATPRPSADGQVFLGIRNITDGGRLDLTDVRHIAEEDYPKWTRRVTPQPGDIVFTYEATLNRYAIIPEGFRGCLGRRLALIRPDPGIVDTHYLFYYFFSKQWRDTIATNINIGATVDRIPLIEFPRFPVRLPRLPTQRKIASVLSAYDHLIENNCRRAEILEQMSQALYREWFVKFRFPGHQKVRFVHSQLGAIPEGWDVKPLLECADVVYGFPFKSKQFNTVGDGDPVVRIRDIPAGRSETFTLEEGDTKHRIHNGDILVGMDGDFHMAIWSGGDAWQNQRVARFHSKGQFCNYHLFLALRDPIQFFNSTITGTTVAHLGHKHIKTIEIAVPSTELLQSAANILEPMAEVQLSLSLRNDILRRARDLLLPKLISGELDVSELDIPIPGEAA